MVQAGIGYRIADDRQKWQGEKTGVKTQNQEANVNTNAEGFQFPLQGSNSQGKPSLGYLVRPSNGARLPILALKDRDRIQARGEYVDFETSIRAAIRGGYSLEESCGDLRDAWDLACAERERASS
jgi:hypothetical protein